MPTIAIRPSFDFPVSYTVEEPHSFYFPKKKPDLHLHFLLRSLRLQIYSQWKRHEPKEMIHTLQSNSRWLLVTLWRLVEAFDLSFADIEVLEVFIKSLEVWKNSCTKTSFLRWAKLKAGKSTDALKANLWQECFPLFLASFAQLRSPTDFISRKQKPGLHLHFLLESLRW